jgi:uncharacterized protein YndB with AHSA1/START domain
MKFVNTARMSGIVFITLVFLVASNTFAAKTNLNFINAMNNDEAGTGRGKLVEKRDVVITRVFDAPVETVWKAWTDPEFVKRWWGPTGFTSHSSKIDFRVGGKYVFHMRAPKDFQGGQDFYTAGVYKKIVPLQLIEFTQGLSDKDGNPIDPAAMGMPPDFPKEIPSSLVFKRVGSKTELTVTEYGWTAGQMRDMSESGMSECLNKLATALAKH